MEANGIKHSRVAPYHPRSNGAAERFVQTFKKAMKKMSHEGRDQTKQLANFLLMYRKTPQATTQETPAMLLTKRNPRSRIDLLWPNLRSTVEKKQEAQKRNHHRNTKEKEFRANDERYGLDTTVEVNPGPQVKSLNRQDRFHIE